jgi:hypothetical protein
VPTGAAAEVDARTGGRRAKSGGVVDRDRVPTFGPSPRLRFVDGERSAVSHRRPVIVVTIRAYQPPAPPPPPPPENPPEKPPPEPVDDGGENAAAVADVNSEANEPIELSPSNRPSNPPP